jgi:hypothetical protein
VSHEKRRGRPRLFSFVGRFKRVEPGADTDFVSLTLSPPTRGTALVGALVLTGLAAVVFLLVGRGALAGEPTVSSTPASATTPAARAVPTPKPAVAAPAKAKPKPRVASGFPAKIDRALRYNRVVVVSVSMPRAAVDTIVRREARAGAKAARAGFVAVSATNERVVSALVAKTGVLSAPAVIVVERPGVVASTFSVTDAGTIAQAVVQARSRR